METFIPNSLHRRSIRLKVYDYSREGLFFVTICVQDRVCLFGKIKHEKMLLNQFGEIAQQEFGNSTWKYKELKAYKKIKEEKKDVYKAAGMPFVVSLSELMNVVK